MRLVLSIVLLLLSLIHWVAAGGTNASTCGTCDSLGYQCIGPVNVPLDNCGAPLNASTCPVPSCADYCLAMFSITSGYCSPTAHTCICDTTSACDRPLCDRLGDLYAQCIPANTVDDCTGNTVPADTCTSTRPLCGTNCTCSATDGTCHCPGSPSTGGGHATVNSTGPIKAAVVPTTTRITSGSKTFVFGSGAIGGTTIQAVIAAGFIGAVMYTWYWKQHPAKFSGGV